MSVILMYGFLVSLPSRSGRGTAHDRHHCEERGYVQTLWRKSTRTDRGLELACHNSWVERKRSALDHTAGAGRRIRAAARVRGHPAQVSEGLTV
jgi:hypothetical protein